MRHIVVIGAGQAGLLLGIGLLQHGHRVTLVADRAPEQILHGPVPAGAVVFDGGRLLERELRVNFWDDTAQPCEAVRVDVVAPDGTRALSFQSELRPPGVCVDQRLKCYRFLQEFQQRGGELVIKPATVADLEGWAPRADLVVVAAGKGEIAALFPRDAARSPFTAAPRHVSMVAVTGYKGWECFHRPGVRFIILPGVGEVFSAPFYAKDQVQAIFLGYEAIPGSPLDRFRAGMAPSEQLALSKQMFHDLVPDDYAAIADCALVDANACLHGRIVPVVRSPVGTLPSGAHVMGLADAVNLHDPIAAQGANNAAKAARILIRRIVEHGDLPFTPAWMNQVFAEVWEDAQYANLLAEKLLAPPEPHMLEILGAATQHPAVASRFVNGIAQPRSMFPWFAQADMARQYLASVSAAGGSLPRQ
jgi:2-polyprenyl-6-methoxyphenol hydroxylase-like FAD-dependent oxidoreductase